MAITLKELRTLCTQLPEVTSTASGLAQFQQQQIDPLTLPPLQNYLRHYNIHFTEQGLAKAYCIWQQVIDQHKIISQHWQAHSARATLFIVHGYLDHAGLYQRAIKWALTQNLSVVVFDLPGHGLSSGQPASINSFDEYTQTLSAIVKQYRQLTTEPFYSLGQSTGCAVIADYLLHDSSACFSKSLLLAPLVRCRAWSALRWLYFAMRPFVSDIKRSFANSSHNAEFQRFLLQDDPLQAKRIALSWLGAMDDWVTKVKHAHPVQHDIMIIQGDGDKTVDWIYNLPALEDCFPNHHTLIIPEAAHHLVNESESFWLPVEKALDNYF